MTFCVLYLIAGLSDMIDGTFARRMNTVSEFGARFDTAADFVLVVVCLIKFLTVISIPAWLYVWIVLLFILPLTFLIVPLKYLAIPVCAVATLSAVQEGHFIRTDPGRK